MLIRIKIGIATSLCRRCIKIGKVGSHYFIKYSGRILSPEHYKNSHFKFCLNQSIAEDSSKISAILSDPERFLDWNDIELVIIYGFN